MSPKFRFWLAGGSLSILERGSFLSVKRSKINPRRTSGIKGQKKEMRLRDLKNAPDQERERENNILEAKDGQNFFLTCVKGVETERLRRIKQSRDWCGSVHCKITSFKDHGLD